MARPASIIDELSRPFWEAAKSDVLKVQKCPDGSLRWPPHPDDVHAHSARHEWEAVSGRGTILSFSIIRRTSWPDVECPYVLAVVQLAEGPVVTCNIVASDSAIERLAPGQAVSVRFEAYGDKKLPVFSAVGSA